jgi:hypothetical protein
MIMIMLMIDTLIEVEGQKLLARHLDAFARRSSEVISIRKKSSRSLDEEARTFQTLTKLSLLWFLAHIEAQINTAITTACRNIKGC